MLSELDREYAFLTFFSGEEKVNFPTYNPLDYKNNKYLLESEIRYISHRINKMLKIDRITLTTSMGLPSIISEGIKKRKLNKYVIDVLNRLLTEKMIKEI